MCHEKNNRKKKENKKSTADPSHKNMLTSLRIMKAWSAVGHVRKLLKLRFVADNNFV